MKPVFSFAAILEPVIINKVVPSSVFRISKRNLFGIVRGKKIEYANRKLIGYSSEQMFDIVSDVGNYYKFLPFCKHSNVITSRPDFLHGELQIGFPPIVESYTSKVAMAKPYLVKAICTDGRLFNELETRWRFSPGLKQNTQTCIVDFYIKFEFKSVFHSQLANVFFEKLCTQMEKAFIEEAKRRFGQASLPSHTLTFVKT